ncbi:rcc01693 family protein [Antarcticimicrobium sediminis]|uniref:Phage tail assembly chaperone n=1 Tax=Antarcticimicrobium sediminis TaxID=2546227 RepID=A0A4R5EZC0_9RHOB|nr:rcc01693 family protein [Antarcticimicrobium sediminis]TDE40322.1 phage tail assembly chaperone [Antarcticimicrobium sediminis]
MSGIDWPTLMRAGFQALRLRPEEFWHLTPAELALMLGQGQGRAPMSRGGLEALLAQWPDVKKGGEDGG